MYNLDVSKKFGGEESCDYLLLSAVGSAVAEHGALKLVLVQ